jgi:hypothetical protein
MDNVDGGALGFTLSADCLSPSRPTIVFVNRPKERFARHVYHVVITINIPMNRTVRRLEV